MIGLGIVTYNRPEYFKQCIDAVIKHLADKVDVIFVYNDGTPYPPEVYPNGVVVSEATENKGVATAKNACLKYMMDAGCDWLFVMEDDIIVKSPDVLDMYMACALDTGINHLMFAHHGPDNTHIRTEMGTAALYGSCVGAFTMYTREGIETVGYFDEGFFNAIEHIEHTYRLSEAGFHPHLYMGYADLALSKHFLEEIPGSIEQSSIRARKDWKQNIIKGLEHWKQKDTKNFPYDGWIEQLEKEIADESINDPH